LYASPNIIRVIKSRRIIWAGHVSCMKKLRNLYEILVCRPDDRKEATWET